MDYETYLFCKCVKELQLATTKKEKESTITRIWKTKSNKSVVDVLNMLLNPLVTFGLKEASLLKQVEPHHMRRPVFTSLYDLCSYLSRLRAVTDADIYDVQQYLSHVHIEQRDIIFSLLCKTLRLGITAKTVNEVLGWQEIPVFECMLANKYFDHPNAVDGKQFVITEKLDGIRCLAVVRNDERPQLFSRQGQRIEGLEEIEDELLAAHRRTGMEYVLDGELLIDGRNLFPSKEQYKRTTKIVRRDGAKKGIVFNAFDIIGVNTFIEHNCDTPYYMRRQKLDTLFSVGRYVRPLPVLYIGSDVSKIYELLEDQRKQDHEGVMINLLDAHYEFKRTNALLKVKVMSDCDLKIIGVEEGSGKFKGTLGALVVDYKGTPVGVGSGLSDKIRKEIWSNPDAYIGRVATIQYFEETNDKDGKLSIRFPVFKELREEGKEVSYS